MTESGLEDEREADEPTRFGVGVSIDKDHFLRRTCPSCGRDFKTEIDEAGLSSALAPAFARLGFELGGITLDVKEQSSDHFQDVNTSDDPLSCPFCLHVAEPAEMLTEEFASYARRLVYREVVVPMFQRTFGDFGGNSGSKIGSGLISVEFSYDRGSLPVRPIHGPEPRDMKVVRMLCCGRRLKVPDPFWGLRVCPYCRTAVKLV